MPSAASAPDTQSRANVACSSSKMIAARAIRATTCSCRSCARSIRSGRLGSLKSALRARLLRFFAGAVGAQLGHASLVGCALHALRAVAEVIRDVAALEMRLVVGFFRQKECYFGCFNGQTNKIALRLFKDSY